MTLWGIVLIAVAILALAFRDHLKIRLETLIGIFFSIFLLTSGAYIITLFINGNEILATLGSLWMYAAFAFTLIHASKGMGFKGTTIFFSIALLSGFLSEYAGTAYGWIYGSYYYQSLHPFFFGLVPLATPISWAIIIYACFTLTNMFYQGFGGKEITRSKKNMSIAIGLLLLLSIIDGLIAVNLDMILDPVAVSPQVSGWIWIGGGAYFGIPISNYVGWFFVTLVSTLLFRGYRYYSGKCLTVASSAGPVYIVALYFVYLIINASQAISIGHIEYALIGTATMTPFIILAILMYYIQIANNVGR
jgi:uncharacterized membrane protein